jgi:cytochrome P450
MRPHIAELVGSYLDAIAGARDVDLVADLAAPLPVTVICEMLGIPESDRDQLRAWTHAATVLIDPGDNMAEYVPANEAVQAFDDYLTAVIAERRARPTDDLLSALVLAEEEGDRLSRQELVSMVTLLFGAGHETTVNLIGNGMRAFLDNPDQWRRVVEDPSLVPSAVEEMLRYDSPVQLTGRNVTEDVELEGDTLRRGQQVTVVLGAANRDPDVFADPDRFDVGRNDNRHLAFGGGIHHCLGAPLARIEAQEAVAALAARFPSLEPAGEPVRRETINLRGLASLPVAIRS